jgi:uncharacterized protein (DUF1697 family)
MDTIPMKQIYLALLRGINVGGNNIIKMADLKRCFEESGFDDVTTYIQSGNVVFTTASADAKGIPSRIESILSKRLSCDSRVIVISQPQLRYAVAHAPDGFGQDAKKFRYDVLFLRPPLRPSEVIKQIPFKEGVDRVYAGKHVLYFSRLIAKASQSRLSKIVSLPVYKEMTIRNWNTTTKLLELMQHE